MNSRSPGRALVASRCGLTGQTATWRPNVRGESNLVPLQLNTSTGGNGPKLEAGCWKAASRAILLQQVGSALVGSGWDLLVRRSRNSGPSSFSRPVAFGPRAVQVQARRGTGHRVGTKWAAPQVATLANCRARGARHRMAGLTGTG